MFRPMFAVLVGVVLWHGGGSPLHAADRPNLILIMADDMGYADLSSFGGTAVKTPNIDALASTGMRFTQYYAASAVCTPTRAAVLTGRYPLRFDIRRHFPDDESHLPRGTVTLPRLLRSAGYATAHVGKWHLGGLHQKHLDDRAQSIPGPQQHGFEHYLTQLEDPPVRVPLGKSKTTYRKGGQHLVRDDDNAPKDDRHYTDINGDEAIAYIEQFHREKRPFFINLWFLVPHTPYEPAPSPHLERYEETADGDQLLFRSMMSHMDEKVGQIVAKLKELGIDDNTFILFTSDNGPAWQGNPGRWKAGKTDLHEGGIRVPMIATWPDHIPAGTACDTLAHATDILPTMCAAAGVALPKNVHFDGVNLLPMMTEGRDLQRGTVFWQMDLYPRIQRFMQKPKPYSTEVVRDGRWKMLAREGKATELFDLESDPGETKNLLHEQPERVARMEGELKAWLAEPRRRWDDPTLKPEVGDSANASP
ncbi:Arylsulfatase [Planctomycetes bacterium Pan216]|uniref:Arylsulfatase n=1 Tax=Kolteria novifilia TaxID=2527975 RepID=A0A518BBY3_9BACT|nr:Arylsulfatase [Planctomycetes bacterium Pan216]